MSEWPKNLLTQTFGFWRPGSSMTSWNWVQKVFFQMPKLIALCFSYGISTFFLIFIIIRLIFVRLTIRAIRSEKPLEGPTPGQFLSRIVERNIPIMSVISNPVIESPDVMSDIAKTLSSEAINLGFKGILEQLGQRSVIAKPDDDAFADVPDVMAVRKAVVGTILTA
jgi:hypothetical protein